MTGILYKQFALTIAVSVVISAVVALVLTPALCATMLKPHTPKEHEDWLHRQLNKFNDALERFSNWYGIQLARLRSSTKLDCHCIAYLCRWYRFSIPLLTNVLCSCRMVVYYMIAVNEPPGATADRTMATLGKVASFLEVNDPERALKDEQLFQSVFTVAGFDPSRWWSKI